MLMEGPGQEEGIASMATYSRSSASQQCNFSEIPTAVHVFVSVSHGGASLSQVAQNEIRIVLCVLSDLVDASGFDSASQGIDKLVLLRTRPAKCRRSFHDRIAFPSRTR